MSQPWNEYRARKMNLPRTEYISFSKIKTALQAPEYLWAEYGMGRTRDASPDMLDSKRIDLLLLEPETYKRTVAVSHYENFFRAEAKLWRDEQLAQGKLIITAKQHRDDMDLQEAVMGHPKVSEIFSRLDWRRHGYATDPELGLLYSETDLRTTDGMIGDIKAVRSVDTEAFNAQVFYMHWYVQLGFYGHVDSLIEKRVNRGNKFFIAVEKFFPYRTRVFTLPGDYDSMAEKIWRKGAEKIVRLRNEDPTFSKRDVWFRESYEITDLYPEYKHVAYHPDFRDIQLGG